MVTALACALGDSPNSQMTRTIDGVAFDGRPLGRATWGWYPADASTYACNSGAECCTASSNILPYCYCAGGDPTTGTTVNLNSYPDIIVNSCSTAATVPAPTPAPPVSALGDPHLQNIHGERFDLMKPGVHVLINIPRGVRKQNALLRAEAEARQLGGECTDTYFQELNVTGSWAEAAQVGGYHYQSHSAAIETSRWVTIGKVELKVVHGRTQNNILYLNFFVKHLGRAGLPVGGLLGEDDHEDVTVPSGACLHKLSLQRTRGHSAFASSQATASL